MSDRMDIEERLNALHYEMWRQEKKREHGEDVLMAVERLRELKADVNRGDAEAREEAWRIAQLLAAGSRPTH